jgi:hypothetical protein
MTHLLLLLLWDERRSQVGRREAHMQQRHTGRAMLSKGSNKEACNMKARGCAAHSSTQDGVAGLPGIVSHKCFTVFHECSSMPHDTALQAHRKLRPSKGLLGGHAQHVITQLA